MSVVVKQGDTLNTIAQKMGTSASNLTGYASGNPNLIRPGEVISIKTAQPQVKTNTSVSRSSSPSGNTPGIPTPPKPPVIPPQTNPFAQDSVTQPTTVKTPTQVAQTQSTKSNPTAVQATTQAIKSGANPSLLNNARKLLGDQAYIGLCQAFVEKATQGTQGIYASAIDAWQKQAQKAKTDMSQIKPGDAVYFGPDASNGFNGHTGIYVGNNQFISATYNGIQQNNLQDWMKSTGQKLLGFIPETGNFVGQNIGNLASNISNDVKTVDNDIGGAVNNAGNWLSQKVGQFTNNVVPQAQAAGPSNPTPQPAMGTQNLNPYQSQATVQGTPDWLQEVIVKAANKYNIPPAILSALAEQESGGNYSPRLKQIGGGMGRGIFQIDLGQHPISEQQAFDPKFAADYAAKLLEEGYQKTGNWTDALRYYNGGPQFDSPKPGYNGQSLHNITMGYANKVNANLKNLTPYLDKKGKGKELPENMAKAAANLNLKYPVLKSLPQEGLTFARG